MAEHPNAALLRKGHEAFSRGDTDTLSQLFAEGTVWHWPGRNPLSGTHRGRDAVLSLFAKMAEMTNGTLSIDEDHDFLGSDEHAVALFRLSATREGKTLRANLCEVTHWYNGKLTEEWVSVDDQYAFDEFWS